MGGTEMRNETKGKIISAVVVVIVMAAIYRYLGFQNRQMGREAFLIKEGARFDRYFSHPRPWGLTLATSLVLFGGILLVYELLSIGTAKLLDELFPSATSNAPP
jgi:hypothetical protein